MFASLMGEVAELPGMTDEDERYFRDIYDHLIRISDLIDTYRDLLTSSMDVYLSTVSNRLNSVMKQLTVMATVFLPLTFITGFFGQNFGWMVGHIKSPGIFFGLGIGLEIVTVLYTLFKNAAGSRQGGALRRQVEAASPRRTVLRAGVEHWQMIRD
jgi:magnesium transporter